MAGDLKAKHTDFNSRLITASGALLRDYVDGISCLIDGSDSPTTVPYQQNVNPDVLDIVVAKDFVFPVVSDGLLCTQIGSAKSPDRHYVPNILSAPLRPPRFQASGLGVIPGLSRRQTPWESLI
jgi:hypothetical protein